MATWQSRRVKENGLCFFPIRVTRSFCYHKRNVCEDDNVFWDTYFPRCIKSRNKLQVLNIKQCFLISTTLDLVY